MNLVNTLKSIKRKLIKNPNIKNKEFYYKCLDKPVTNAILYEAFAGLGILDNPRAIFKELLSSDKFKNYTHVWSVADIEMMQDNLAEFENFSNVVIVKRESKDYYRYLATAKYLINNSTFGYYFAKRDEQVYINTWHGIPTKYMGYEHLLERVENARGPARNYLDADYLVSASPFMTDVMYNRAYMAKGLFEGKILELGYPRMDAITNTDRKYILGKLEKAGIDTDKKIVLYAPTWKGQLYNKLEYDLEEFKNTVKRLQESVPADYKVYIRVHYFIYKELAADNELKQLLIPFTIDTNELLSVVDVLISDYSSIFFDFLKTEKPVIFFVPDLETYESGRGLYVPVEKLPGPVCKTLEETCSSLEKLTTSDYACQFNDKYQHMLNWCAPKDDGAATRRLISAVFDEKYDEFKCTGNIVGRDEDKDARNTDAKKTKVLFFIDWKSSKGKDLAHLKTTLENMDFSGSDVTLFTPVFTGVIPTIQYFHKLPKEVRILTWNPLPFDHKLNDRFMEKEIRRTLGQTHFDYVFFVGSKTPYWEAFYNTIDAKDKNYGTL